MTTKTYAFEDTLVWTGYRNKGYCESVQSSKTFEVLYQKVHEIIVTSHHPEPDRALVMYICTLWWEGQIMILEATLSLALQ